MDDLDTTSANERALAAALACVRVSPGDFDLSTEVAALRADNPKVGAVACFVGTVRDLNEGQTVEAMELEHYPGMTEKALEAITEPTAVLSDNASAQQ